MTRAEMPGDRLSDATQPERPPPPGSDATELERPPPAAPDPQATQLSPSPYGTSGSDATELEHPASPPPGSPLPPRSPLPPGYPPGVPYPPAPLTGVAAPSGLYPYPGGGYPPPVQPPAQRRRSPALAIVGALLVLLVIAAGITVLVTRHRGDARNTQQTADLVANVTTAANATVAVIPPTLAAQPATPTAPTASPAPSASAAPALSGPTDTWTDQENRITVRYPADWQKDTFDTRDETSSLEKSQPLVELTGPERVRVSVSIYLSTQTLSQDVQAFRNAVTSDPKLAFSFDPAQDVTVGGEPATLLNGSYMQNGATMDVAVWFVDHDRKRFALAADRIGTHRNEVDAIVASALFVPTGLQVTPTSAATATRAATPLATTASIFGTPVATRTPLPTSLTVTLTDTAFTVSPTPIQAGTVPITISNMGSAPYTVALHGSGVDYLSPVIPPGQTVRVSLTFQRGQYMIVCNVSRPLTGTFDVQ